MKNRKYLKEGRTVRYAPYGPFASAETIDLKIIEIDHSRGTFSAEGTDGTLTDLVLNFVVEVVVPSLFNLFLEWLSKKVLKKF